MTWKNEKLLAQLDIVQSLGDLVVVSGGLAWHIISPPHIEEKIIHDHSDIDLFAIPETSYEVFSKLKSMGYNQFWTKYNTKNFYRYGQTIQKGVKRVKILIDLYVEKVPFIKINGYQIVEPSYLLSLYETTHSSKDCTAVKNATLLMNKNINPIGRMELIGKKQLNNNIKIKNQGEII